MPSDEWREYAELVSSANTAKRWRVQQHVVTKALRCNCPSYIFSGRGGKTRTCKHLDLVAIKDPKHQHVDTLLTSACQEANVGLKSFETAEGRAKWRKLVEAVAARMDSFVPPAGHVQATGTSGVRCITFDE